MKYINFVAEYTYFKDKAGKIMLKGSTGGSYTPDEFEDKGVSLNDKEGMKRIIEETIAEDYGYGKVMISKLRRFAIEDKPREG